MGEHTARDAAYVLAALASDVYGLETLRRIRDGEEHPAGARELARKLCAVRERSPMRTADELMDAADAAADRGGGS